MVSLSLGVMAVARCFSRTNSSRRDLRDSSSDTVSSEGSKAAVAAGMTMILGKKALKYFYRICIQSSQSNLQLDP